MAHNPIPTSAVETKETKSLDSIAKRLMDINESFDSTLGAIVQKLDAINGQHPFPSIGANLQQGASGKVAEIFDIIEEIEAKKTAIDYIHNQLDRLV